MKMIVEQKKEVLNSLEAGKEYKITIFSTKTFQEIEIVGEVKKSGVNKIFKYHTKNGKATVGNKQIHLNSLVRIAKWIKVGEEKENK